MKHIFIVNPAAGVGASEKVHLPQLIQYLKQTGVDYEIHRTLNKEEVGTWTKQRASVGDPVRFYAVGGDGTICDVVNGVIGFPNVEVAAIPCGTGNDFVKNFTNKKNFLNLEAQVKGTAVLVDAIKYNDNYCLNMLNIGADCDIVVRSNQLKAEGKANGAASYAIAALQVLPKNPKYKFSYVINGEKKEEELMLVAVGNGMYCGGGFKSCPKARLNDGLMDVGFVKPCRGLKLYQLLPKYYMGTHIDFEPAKEYVSYLQLSEFFLEPLDDCVVSVDGEVYKFEPTHVSVVPGAINFVVPEGSEMIK